MELHEIILAKLDKIDNKQTEHTIELAKNTYVLKEHHVRSSNLEARIQPIEKHVILINSTVKIFLSLSAAIGTITLIYKILNSLLHS